MQATLTLNTGRVPSATSAARSTSRSFDRCTPQQLLELSQSGNIEARHCLVGRYRSIINATASQMASNRSDADDIAAEIYLRVYEVINSCRNVRTLPGWIKRIAVNEFYQSCRRQRRQPNQTSLESFVEAAGDGCLAIDSANPATLILEEMEQQERRERVSRALASLPAHHREICELFYAQRRSFEEISAETGLALGTIKSRLFRARETMQRKLADLMN